MIDRLKGRGAYIVVLCALGLSAQGCAVPTKLQAQSRVNPVSSAAYPTTACPLTTAGPGDTRKGAIDLDCFVFPEDVGRQFAGRDPKGKETWVPVDRGNLAYSKAAGDEHHRNRLTSILMKQSDDVCVAELGRLTANEATTNTILSILSTGLSTAATIVGGQQAKSILSGTAALAGASRDHVNVHVYRNTIAQAISQVIASERKISGDAIKARYMSPIPEWSIDDAIRDVNVYHGQCSFYKGLELLLKAADNNTDLQAYRAARKDQTALERIDERIGRARAALAKTADATQKAALATTIGQLELTRSKVGIDPAATDTMPGLIDSDAND